MAFEWNKTNVWSQEAVADFIRQYSDALIRYAYCIVSDAAAAEEVALNAIATFVYRNAQKALSKAYLYRIVRNRAIDYLRLHRRFVPLQDMENVLSAGNVVEAESERADRYQALYRCMAALSVDYRDVLYLHYLEDMPIPDICRAMGKNTKQVYNLLSRAKANLKTLLIKEGFDNEDL